MTQMETRPPAEDVVDLLVRQHAQIRDLFTEVETSTGERRRESFGHLIRLLAVHETAEEEIVHPIARRSLPGGEGIVDDRLREEHDAKELLARLDGMDTESSEFLRELDELRVAVLSHARAEERYEFFRMRDRFGESQRRGMAAAVKAAEATAPTHPHPGTESAAKNMLLGPAVAVADRARDMIRRAGGDVSAGAGSDESGGGPIGGDIQSVADEAREGGATSGGGGVTG